MIFFCPSCFKKIEYKLSKPEACPFCNSSTAAGGGGFKTSPKSVVAEEKEKEKESKVAVNRGKSRVSARGREDEDYEDEEDYDGVGDEFSNPDWRPGYFSDFLNTSRAELRNFGVEVEKSAVSSVSMRDLFPEEAEQAKARAANKNSPSGKKRGRPKKQK
jgi:hypothetical protein